MKKKVCAFWGFALHTPPSRTSPLLETIFLQGSPHIFSCFVCFSAMSGKRGEDSEESKVKVKGIGIKRKGQNMAVRDICEVPDRPGN